MNITRKAFQTLKEHRYAALVAVFIGLVMVGPQFAFRWSLGAAYNGVYMFATPNENAYVGIMHEIIDGHPLVASMPFFEYKDQIPLLPATIAWLYALPTLLLGVSLYSTVIVSKFIFPAILFLSVYAFVYLLCSGEASLKAQAKWCAIVGGLLVVLGFDFVDYRSLAQVLSGQIVRQGFLIWGRPINPISGAIFLFIFVACIWKLWQTHSKKYFITAGVMLALMMASYVFSWTLAVVITGLIIILNMCRKNFRVTRDLMLVLLIGSVLSLPYWINVIRASQSPWYEDASKRIGFFYTHTPHLNKFLIVALLLFGALSAYSFYKESHQIDKDWWWFSFFLIISGLVAYNQQIITGREIWYYHYVFYTIPFTYSALLIILWHVIQPLFPRLWLAIMVILAMSSIAVGVGTQYQAYHARYQEFANRQNYRGFINFFNDAPKDCVVLVKEKNINELSNIIPMFTHCNTYFSPEVEGVLMPPERIQHNYMTILRLRGVMPTTLNDYIQSNKEEVALRLQFELYRTAGQPDQKLNDLLLQFPKMYANFYQVPFANELHTYKIDYILSEDDLAANVKSQLPGLTLVFSDGRYYVYTIQ